MVLASRTPSLRALTLLALILAVGVLSLRAIDLFTGAPEPAASTSKAEQTLTGLLEPVTGAGNVRVAIEGISPRTFLILVNGPEAPDETSTITAERIEAIVLAGTGFQADRDGLTISQFPFASGIGAEISTLKLAEFTGLSLLCTLLLVLIAMPRQPATVSQSDTSDKPKRQPASLRLVEPQTAPAADTDIDRAAQIAASDPGGTARLIRAWISDSDGGRR